MSGCCPIETPPQSRRKILIAVLVINLVMFGLQLWAGLTAHSTSLQADAMDMLGDALTYGLSLYAGYQGGRWLGRAALLKGIIMLFLAFVLLLSLIYHATSDTTPHEVIMLIFACLGLIANGTCFYLLSRHRDSDINMRSTWICARNDIMGNLSVLLAAGLVYLSNQAWPDLAVGTLLTAWISWNGYVVTRDAIRELRQDDQ